MNCNSQKCRASEIGCVIELEEDFTKAIIKDRINEEVWMEYLSMRN